MQRTTRHEDSGMNRKWIALVLLTLSTNFACAASFDCGKAGTKVEKMICADPELSELDVKLGEAYSKARDVSSTTQDELKQQQRDWIKKRNECSDSRCLSQIYESRIIKLGKIVASSKTQEDFTTENTEHTYPPYPDVWEMRIPINDLKIKKIYAKQLKNGDIKFGYVVPDYNGVKWITFFARNEGRDTSDNDWMKQEHASSASGTLTVERVGDYASGYAELVNGGYVISSQNSFWRGCYQGPAGNHLYRYDTKDAARGLSLKGKPLNKVVFFLLDKPVTILTGTRAKDNAAACDAVETEITTRVVSLGGWVVPLQDGGFLLVSHDYGVVIRFDNKMNTSSRWLNKKLFVRDIDRLDTIFIDKITKHSYMEKPGLFKMQQITGDLYNYLADGDGEK